MVIFSYHDGKVLIFIILTIIGDTTKKIFFRIYLILIVGILLSIIPAFGEEALEDTFCYDVPDTVRSLSIVTNGYYTGAVGVGEEPEIFICDEDGIRWGCKKRALSILLSSDGRYTLVGMSDGVELYDNSMAVDISKSITKEIVSRWVDAGVLDNDGGPAKMEVKEEKITESTIYTCNPLWKYTTKTETRVLGISDSMSYFIVGSGDTLYSITKQGQLSWKYQADSTINYIATKGNYIAVASQRTVYLFKINGDQMWNFSVSGAPEVLAVTLLALMLG